jgi:hypothetical protein
MAVWRYNKMVKWYSQTIIALKNKRKWFNLETLLSLPSSYIADVAVQQTVK